jgi:hypothetical membrane protein
MIQLKGRPPGGLWCLPCVMHLRTNLLFGPLAAVLLFLGIFVLGLLLPGYSGVRQTVSEIGEVGSPQRIPFAVLLCAVAICLIIFARALLDLAKTSQDSRLPAFLVAAMGLSAAGVGIFAYPHPLHNIFGISELIGYQAPLALALTWRSPQHVHVVRFSWIFYALVLLAIAANLGSLDTHSALWLNERPFYGLVQRGLFAVWFLWCVGVAALLHARTHAETQSFRSQP